MTKMKVTTMTTTLSSAAYTMELLLMLLCVQLTFRPELVLTRLLMCVLVLARVLITLPLVLAWLVMERL